MTSWFDDERIDRLISAVMDAVAREDDTTDLVEEYSLGERASAMETLFNRGEYQHVHMFLSPDHVHDVRPVHVPGMGVYRGRDAYQQFIREWTDAFPGATLETEFVFEIDEPVDAVFTISRQHVRGGASEVPVVFRFALIAEYSAERHESTFGTDIEEMRETFRSRYGQDPGPFDFERLGSEERQEA